MKALNDDSLFKKFILYSCVSHVLLVGFFLIKDNLFSNADDVVIKNAIQVDIVDLPDKPKKVVAKKKPVAKPAPKVIVAKKKKKTFSKNTQSKAFSKLKAMKAIDKIQAQQQAIERAKQIEQAKAEIEKEREKLKKGNVITNAGGLSGLDRIQMNEYYEKVRSHVHAHFEIPNYMMNQNFNAKAVIKIDSLGNVLVKDIILPSGNEVFDTEVLTAIDKSSPLPQPPDRLRGQLEKSGFILGFPE